MKKDFDKGFLDQLPETGHYTVEELYPRLEELNKYQEWFFDPRYDGYENELEYIGDLPFHTSKEVKSSPLGVGFEVLDHRTAYDFQKVMPFARNTGVKWARVQTGWQRAEKEVGKYDFAWLDEIVDGLQEAGIEPWLSLSFGNPLYMDGAEPIPPHNNYFYSPTRFGEKGVNGWINYCKAMVEHFKDRITYWEIWNEPNAGFMRQPGDLKTMIFEIPDTYAELVAISEKAIHSVQPEAKILGGSVSGGRYYSLQYIHGLFRCGIADHIDIFSYHPYGAIPEFCYPEILEKIREFIKASGKNIPIWQGENGRPSDTRLTKRGWKTTEGSQARFLTRRYITDLKLGIEMTSYFQMCDLGNGYAPNGNVHSQGVIDATDPENYRPKLSYRAMQSMAWLFDSRTQLMNSGFDVFPMPDWNATTLPLEAAFATTCAFRRGNIPIFAYYHPSHLDADWMVKPITVNTWLAPEFKFDKLILIDPITARIYRLKRRMDWESKKDGNIVEIPRLPLLDYPLFVTDASLLEDLP